MRNFHKLGSLDERWPLSVGIAHLSYGNFAILRQNSRSMVLFVVGSRDDEVGLPRRRLITRTIDDVGSYPITFILFTGPSTTWLHLIFFEHFRNNVGLLLSPPFVCSQDGETNPLWQETFTFRNVSTS